MDPMAFIGGPHLFPLQTERVCGDDWSLEMSQQSKRRSPGAEAGKGTQERQMKRKRDGRMKNG